MAMITSFSQSPEGSGPRKIFLVIKKALEYIAVSDFINMSIQNVIANVPTLTPSQRIALKYSCRAFPMERWDENIDNLMKFVLYGKFQDVDIPEAADEPLTDEQRAGLLQIIFMTAQGVVQAKVSELQGILALEFDLGDWIPQVIEEPIVEPPTE